MPYIVIERPSYWDGSTEDIYTSRRAFRDLDLAKETVEKKIRDEWGYFGKSIKSPPDHLRDLRDMTNQGGKIGMLPDGTMIVVESCDRFWLLSQMGRDEYTSDTTDEIIDAYNAMSASIVG